MQDYVIFVDTSADVDRKLAESGEFRFIPMNYTLGDEERTCSSLESDELLKLFYDGQRHGDLTRTSQITPQLYLDLFEPELAAGRSVLYISLSSGLTKTFDNVKLAKQELDEKYTDAHVYPVDSLSATGGMGLLSEYAIENKRSGMSVEDNYAACVEMSHKICHLFIVDDMMYLKRGGRVPASTAVIATVLNIKPILIIDSNGKLVTIDKKRGAKLAIKDMYNKYLETRDLSIGKRAYITHADAPDKAEMTARLVLDNDPDIAITSMMLCPIIGAHVGPGMVTIDYFGDRDKLSAYAKPE